MMVKVCVTTVIVDFEIDTGIRYISNCLVVLIFVFFFFSSRRRHTRYIGDWSSDVCSSDLPKQKKHWNHLFLNREPLEPLVPIQENIGTTHF